MDKTEQEIIKSQILLQRVINLLPIRVFWKDKNLVYLGCNNLFAKDAGKEKPDDLIGKDDFSMVWKEQAELYRADDKKVIESGKEKLDFEEPQTTPNGDTIWLKTSKVPLIDMQGNNIGILGMYEDITERKRMEDLLKKQREEQQIILDSVPAWIFYKDKENKFIRINSAFANVMNMPKEQLENKSAFDIYPKEQADAFWKDDKEVMLSGKPKVNIIESMNSPQGMLWVQTDKIPYRDAQGNIIGIIGFTINITERKKIEEILLEKNAELERFNKIAVGRELKMVELKNKIKELEEKLQSK